MAINRRTPRRTAAARRRRRPPRPAFRRRRDSRHRNRARRRLATISRGMAIQRDGKILVGGDSDMGDGAGGFQWRITRYTRNGDSTPPSAPAGTVLTSMTSEGGFDERMVALAVQRDGKIVAAGCRSIGPRQRRRTLPRWPATTLTARSIPAFGDGGMRGTLTLRPDTIS